jgi:ParB/RepB/Spo0J family partition protein
VSTGKGKSLFNQITTRSAAATSSSLKEKTIAGAIILPLSQLVPNFQQVRQYFDEVALDEFAEDIKNNGILEPLLVREAEPGTYEIIAGERRYRAAHKAGLTEVPVIVREMSDKEARLAMLSENLQRQDLDPRDEQRFFQALQHEYNYSITDLAKIVNKSRDYVRNRLEGKLNVMQPAAETEATISEINHETCPKHELQEISQSVSDSSPNVASKKATLSKYNPAVYKRVYQFWDNTLEVVKNKPDRDTVAKIKGSLQEMKQKLAELEQELISLEVEEEGKQESE